MRPPFDLQGHRGARGLAPENTLPGFETALDLGVTSIETDLHLTSDGQVVLVHDCRLGPPVYRPATDSPRPTVPWVVPRLTLADVQTLAADGNPSAERFPHQSPTVTPLARRWAEARGRSPWAVPSLADLFAFVDAYAGDEGVAAGKPAEARARACALRFDLELKRVPFRPEAVGDAYDGTAPALLEQRLVEAVRAAGVVDRTTVRSFDHRCVALLRRLEPRLEGAILMAPMMPVDAAALARAGDASLLCPYFEFVDEALVRRCHEGGVAVIPWTVNDEGDMRRLLAWGVDGITTDYPDRLAGVYRAFARPSP